MFCNARPRVTLQAALSLSLLKLTPAAMPSGSLCIAMAKIKRRILFICSLFACSSGSRPVSLCKCGVILSSKLKNKAPSITPIATCHQPALPAISVAGRIRPITDAASIMPAQNPIIISFHLWLSPLNESPIIEPITDERHKPTAEIQTDCIFYYLLYLT